MGASALMSIGSKAMAASYAALATTGHNIANANVAGYSRQQVELATAQSQYTGAGFFGKGVDVSTVSRAHDALLTREAASTRALAAMDAARLQMLQRLEAAFPTGEQGIGYAAGQFLNAMTDLAAHPADASTRQVVLARAGDAARAFATAGGQLDALQQAVHEDLRVQVAQLNQLAAGVADVNQRIAAVTGLGQPPNDLLDERERLLGQISEHLQISTVAADDGTVGVFIAGGQRLVLGSQAQTLSVEPDPADPARAAVGISDSGFVRLLPAAELGGGAIAGLLRFQNEDLTTARAQLGQLGADFAAAVNRQQALGLDLRTPPASGAPIFSADATQCWLTDPRGLAAASPVTAAAAAGNTGTAAIASLRVVGPTIAAGQVLAITFIDDSGGYEWELRAGPAGPVLDHDSGNWSAATPIALHGFELALSGVPRSGDAFSVVPTAYPSASNGNALAFVDLRDARIVGGSPAGGGATITDAYASVLAGVGVRVQGAGTTARTSAAAAAQAEQARSAVSGVNLDEEAARLIQFQQSYQAAAKILQVAQSVFDTLLQSTGS